MTDHEKKESLAAEIRTLIMLAYDLGAKKAELDMARRKLDERAWDVAVEAYDSPNHTPDDP